jgi:hypothetical protein
MPAFGWVVLFLLLAPPDDPPAEPPPVQLQDLDRFPCRECVTSWCRFSRDYRCRLRDELSLGEAWRERALWAALDQARDCYQPWDLLEDAQAEWRDPACRLEMLEALRDLIGPEAYYTGRMPPPVPLWHWREVDRYP